MQSLAQGKPKCALKQNKKGLILPTNEVLLICSLNLWQEWSFIPQYNFKSLYYHMRAEFKVLSGDKSDDGLLRALMTWLI